MIAIQTKSVWTILNPVEKIRPLLKHYDLSLCIRHLWCNLIELWCWCGCRARASRSRMRTREIFLSNGVLSSKKKHDCIFYLKLWLITLILFNLYLSFKIIGKCPWILSLQEKAIKVANNALVFTFDWSTSKNWSWKPKWKEISTYGKNGSSRETFLMKLNKFYIIDTEIFLRKHDSVKPHKTITLNPSTNRERERWIFTSEKIWKTRVGSVSNLFQS